MFLGLGGGAISGIRYGVPRLVAGITRQLFVDHAAHYYQSLVDYVEPELPPTVLDEV